MPVALALVALALAGCSSGGFGPWTLLTRAGELYKSPVGPDGGRIEVPAGDDMIGGLVVEVPAGALGEAAELSVQARPQVDPTVRALAEREPELHLAAVSYALDNAETGEIHPLYGPLFALSGAEFAGPQIVLGPDGAAFATPVEVRAPFAALGIGEGEAASAMPLARSADGTWEVVSDFSVDTATGVATARVSHFSVLQWIKNLIWSPVGVGTAYGSGAVKDALGRLPQNTLSSFAEGAVCSKQEPAANLKKIPGLPTLLDYLGFEAGAVRSGQERNLEKWITDQFQEARAGTRQYNSITLGQLFGKAMELTGGDIFQALVTAHNTLRDKRDSPSVQQMIENYRGDGGDERGARYHMFGMALYSFAYEYFLEKTNIVRESGQLVIGTEALDPRVVATIEESVVSGDIVSDVPEYAVDLQGAELGRQLYRQVRNAQRGDLVSRFSVNEACDGSGGGGGWAVYRITNYGSAKGGYLTVAEVGTEKDPPLLSGYPGGGLDPNLRVAMERLDASATFRTPEEAAKSLCGQLKDFFRPVLASFIQEGYFNGVEVGLDGIFVDQCPQR
ncbi:MAG TPA: hypothetical protein VJ253_09555 [Dehalococcoidia bacterium]|nr:hypothetical protein [Dehalococcoidia bacterium]